MKNSWTPGPWRTESRGGSYPVSVVSSDRPDKIVGPFCGGSTPEDTANAHLIAAAPDLYEALDALVSPRHGHSNLCKCPWCNARAALAKARGEPS
jgi:hypothetical protein